MNYFSVDGLDWQYPCNITRISQMTPSEISGMLLNKNYFNDVLGTFLRYDVAFAVPLDDEESYATMYEQLTKPVDAHTFILPYNDDFVTITGRVESVQDTFVRLPGDKHYWHGTKFAVIANHPTKQMSLSQVLAAGLSPFPPTANVAEDSTWQYTEDGWESYTPPSYDDADDIYY